MTKPLVLVLLGSLLLWPAWQTPTDFQSFDQLMTQLSNWGRWGKQDEMGTMNLITPAKRKEAARLVKEGFAVSLAHDAEKETGPDNPRPFGHQMISHGSTPEATSHSDQFTIAHHGLAHTHLDSLCHFFHKERMYNGYSRQEVTAKGTAKLAVTAFKQGIFTRGLLVDAAWVKGVPYLEPGTAILPEDLAAWEKKTGLKVRPGDVVLFRTGRWAHRAKHGAQAPDKLAGLQAACMRWLKERDIAVVGSDAAMDVRPSGVEGVRQPIHTFVLVALGTPILDNCDLEALSQECQKRNRWEFLLTTAPLAVPGATGSALNPTAVF